MQGPRSVQDAQSWDATMQRHQFVAALTALVVGATGAQAVTPTFTGTVGNNAAGYPWGYDGYGAYVAGDSYTATFNFDLSQGSVQTFGANNLFTASGGYSGTFTVNGHSYAATGANGASYYRGTDFLEVTVYDVPSDFDGVVLYAPLDSSGLISSALYAGVPTEVLAPGDVAASGLDAVLPGGPGALFVSADVETVTVAAPEPAAWTMMLVGLGAAGGALRRRARLAVARA
jgi:PEP-CTERM motif